jgi:glycine/D-amino acid oxidase-like deaminating enzyme
VEARVTAIEQAGDRVCAVRAVGPGGATRIETRVVVDAAGPFVGDVAALLGVSLPVVSELHLKFGFDDDRGVVPRDAPLLIWDDPQSLRWTEEEYRALAADPALAWLTAPLPADPSFPELAMRGVARMIPGLEVYTERLPRGTVDGGYYTRTPENRPLIGPLPVRGAYVLGALSGFGLMAACAAGELLAAHVAGAALPDYAPAFSPGRHDDPAYRTRVAAWGDTGLL